MTVVADFEAPDMIVRDRIRTVLNIVAPLLAVAILVLLVARFLSIPVEDELDFKRRVTETGKVDRLTAWILDGIAENRSETFDPRNLPQELQGMGIKDLRPMRGSGRTIKYVDVSFSGGFRHQGLLIGPQGFRPDEEWPVLKQWCDSVWYYDDGAPGARHR